MSTFLVYDTASGTPKRWGACSETDLPLQAQTGEGVADITALTGWDANEANWIWDGTAVIPKVFTASELLAAAQAAQAGLLQAAYQRGILAPVSYTTQAGTTADFAQDATSKANLQDAIEGSLKTGVWTLGVWLDVSGGVISPFTNADLQGLAAAMEAYDTPKYSELLALLAEVNAATTVAAVQAVIWS